MQENSEEDKASDQEVLDEDDDIPISTEDLSTDPIEKPSITWL